MWPGSLKRNHKSFWSFSVDWCRYVLGSLSYLFCVPFRKNKVFMWTRCIYHWCLRHCIIGVGNIAVRDYAARRTIFQTNRRLKCLEKWQTLVVYALILILEVHKVFLVGRRCWQVVTLVVGFVCRIVNVLYKYRNLWSRSSPCDKSVVGCACTRLVGIWVCGGITPLILTDFYRPAAWLAQ